MHVYFFLITDTMQEILVLGVCLSFVLHEYDTVIFLIVVPLAEKIISFLVIIYLFFRVNSTCLAKWKLWILWIILYWLAKDLALGSGSICRWPFEIWMMGRWGVSPLGSPFCRWGGSLARMDYCNIWWLTVCGMSGWCRAIGKRHL